jgi:hypothetical protein
MGESISVYRVLVGKLEGKRQLEDPHVNGRIISRWFFRKWGVKEQTGSTWHRIGTGGRHL